MTQDPIDRLIAHGDDDGCVCMSHLEELVQELALDDERTYGAKRAGCTPAVRRSSQPPLHMTLTPFHVSSMSASPPV
jgi:hypothetical protein